MKGPFAALCLAIASVALLIPTAALAEDAPKNPFIGHWGLTVRGDKAGWLGISVDSEGKLHASILWAVASVVPVMDAKLDDDALVLTQHTVLYPQEPNYPKDGDGKPLAILRHITAKADGDSLKGTAVETRLDGTELDKGEFTGKRTPPLPPAPDLSKVKFGPAIKLFNGKDLTGWKLTNPNDLNGWGVTDGILVNVQDPASPRQDYGNLRTEQEFEDFNITCETNLPKHGNSGVYLRGIYEVQVLDSFGKPLDSHNMGALYSRITPSESAEKRAGEWQTLDITLVDRHVTVILNGKKIIDNKPVLGCTGGALWSDPMRPGPIYLQGDETSANFRNIVIRPVIKQ